MAAVIEKTAADPTDSGNTSRDSKGSGKEKSMLELLSITDAAVKALNKSTRSLSSTSSHASRKSNDTNQSQHSDQSVQSHHSGKSIQSAQSIQSNKSVHSQHSDNPSVHSRTSQHSVASVRSKQSNSAGQPNISDHSVQSRQSDRSTKSQQSHQSRSSTGQPQPLETQKAPAADDVSQDSGVVSKSRTLSEVQPRKPVVVKAPSPAFVHDSDESTTASEVLIHSTVDKNEPSLLGMNSSITSKCSKTSYGAENFNSSGPQKVKVSKKYLREIEPPLVDMGGRKGSGSGSGSGSVSGDSKVPSSLLNGHGSDRESSASEQGGRNFVHQKQNGVGDRDRNVNSKGFPKGLDKPGQFKVDKTRKVKDSTVVDVNVVDRRQPPVVKVVKEVPVEAKKRPPTETAKPEPKLPPAPFQQRSTPKYFVERHTPKKVTPAHVSQPASIIPEKKNLLQDLEDSLDDFPQKNGINSSTSSSQPDIVTVQERIVTVSARNSVSPASSVGSIGAKLTSLGPGSQGMFPEEEKLSQPGASDKPGPAVQGSVFEPEVSGGQYQSLEESYLDKDSMAIPPALSRDKQQPREEKTGTYPARFQWFTRANGAGLQQGAPVTGPDAPDKHKQSDDIEICQFKLTEKQRTAKESLAKRYKDGAPVKRVVQPRLVGHEPKTTSAPGKEEGKGRQPEEQSNEVLTAAAAASAAVAATQPFLKAQYEMEARMKEILAKVSHLQEGKEQQLSARDSERVLELEKQLAGMTEKRIDYMEKLHEQQIAMQARLLSMTREAPVAKSRSYLSPSHSPESQFRKNFTSSPLPKRAFSKTTVQSNGNNSSRQNSARDLEDSAALDTPAPRSRAPKPTTYNSSDIELRPRPRSRSPGKSDPGRGILHQILDGGSPVLDSYRQRPLQPARTTEAGQSPVVRKASHLVEELSSLKDQMRGLVNNADKLRRSTSPPRQPQQAGSKLDDSAGSQVGPAPLDQYLALPKTEASSPYKSVPSLSHSQLNAPVLPGFKDAQWTLHEVQKNRHCLEANLESVLRARQEVEVYSALEALYHDSSNKDKVRIQQMVDKSIAKLHREVEREVTDDLVLASLNKQKPSTVPGAVKVPAPAPAPTKPGAKGLYGLYGRRGLAEPKVDTGTKKAVRRPGGVPDKATVGKENTTQKSRPPAKKAKSAFEDERVMAKVYGKAAYQKGRTTVKDPYIHVQNAAKQKPSRPTGVVETKGVEMMSSKTQTGPSVKQYYFNPAVGTYIPVASASTAPIDGQLIPMAVPLGGPRMDPGLAMSVSKTATPGPVTFNPRPAPQVTAAGNVAMVSVAADESSQKPSPELGKQVLPAVDIDTDLSESVVSEMEPERPKKRVQIQTPERSPNRSAYIEASHTGWEEEIIAEVKVKAKPKVKVGNVPDTKKETSEEKKVVIIAQNNFSENHPNEKPDADKQEHSVSVSLHPLHDVHEKPAVEKQEHSEEPEVEEEYSVSVSLHPHHDVHDDSDRSVEEDADERTATGLVFPGYQPSDTGYQQYNGPQFPPQQPSADRQLTSDLIAEDIRRRDALQNKVTDWVEQELMARMITEVYPLSRPQEPAEISHVVSEMSEDSVAEDREESGFVMDNIGRQGLQLFVDAGVAVDNHLVSGLIKEVLAEKVHSMLGQKPQQEETTPLIPGATNLVIHDELQEPLQALERPRPAQVRTPEPTPRASPTSSPPRRRSPAATPPASPPIPSPRAPTPVQVAPPAPVQVAAPELESETESSVSLDIREELHRLADQLKVAVDSSVDQRHDVATPPTSPKPEPPPQEVYIPASPPELTPRSVQEAPITFQPSAPAAAVAEVEIPPVTQPRPETPVPEEVEEEEEEDQPAPVVVTAPAPPPQPAPVPEVPAPPRTPSPVRKSHSRSPSESSYTESSTMSETFNENISEGQWLISKSEGEVADFPIDDVALRQKMLRSSQRKVDVSSASTWKDIDDVDLDEATDVDRSEGEFLYKTPVMPEDDPVLDLLSRLHSHTPQYGQYQMSSRQVDTVLNTTGRSTGEVTPFGASGKSEGEVIMVSGQREKKQRDLMARPSPSRGEPQARAVSPGKRAGSPTRVSFEDQRAASPTRGILKQSSAPDRSGRRGESVEIPVRDRDRQTPPGRLTPGGRQAQGRGPTVSAGGRTSPAKPGRKPPQVVKSTTSPSNSLTGSRLVQVRSSSEDFRDSLDNGAGPSYYGSDIGARNMTPDQMNMDSLIQSGYLSQSFSQSENGRFSAGSSLRSSRDFGNRSPTRYSDKGRSLGYSYDTEGSMTESELRKLAASGTGTLQMSVTIPGTGGFEEESDLSEIDITEGGNTGP